MPWGATTIPYTVPLTSEVLVLMGLEGRLPLWIDLGGFNNEVL